MVLGVRSLEFWLDLSVLGASRRALAAPSGVPSYVRTHLDDGDLRYGHLGPSPSRPRRVRPQLD